MISWIQVQRGDSVSRVYYDDVRQQHLCSCDDWRRRPGESCDHINWALLYATGWRGMAADLKISVLDAAVLNAVRRSLVGRPVAAAPPAPDGTQRVAFVRTEAAPQGPVLPCAYCGDTGYRMTAPIAYCSCAAGPHREREDTRMRKLRAAQPLAGTRPPVPQSAATPVLTPAPPAAKPQPKEPEKLDEHSQRVRMIELD